MTATRPTRPWRLLLLSALVAVCLAAVSGSDSRASSALSGLSQHIVLLADVSLASYEGGVQGLAPTSPEALGTRKLEPESAASKAYLAYLDQRQASFKASLDQALGRTVSTPVSYKYALNGVVALLTDAEAARVASLPGVEAVEKERLLELHSDNGPAWIGATKVWSGAAGVKGTRGEGVVVGVIDTGVNHDHPSFAATGGDGYTHQNPRGRFYGLCDPLLGKPFCNAKLIGVYDYTGTSPEDDNQHGSHTASTAAGNVLRGAVMHAPTMDITRDLSGVAPHANLITYKACMVAGCLNVATARAIDQAVADGVDVINFSIGGSSGNAWTNSSAVAFLGARDAGVFVAASAGNNGPAARTMGSPANAPWLTAVAAFTHDRKFANALTGLDGLSDMQGAGLAIGYGPAKIVYAGDYGFPLCGVGPALPTGQGANPFPPGTFSGEIVVCDRGVYGRVAKGENVKAAGAGGYVLLNDQLSGDSVISDAHALPAVHLSYQDGLTLKAWLAGGKRTATIAGATLDVNAQNGDKMASFSSRGPDRTHPQVLKPDLGAPGADILAAADGVDPTQDPEYAVLSGTSMSSPHVAGAAALMVALHPAWTPAEVQSALMTTAKTPLTESGKEVGAFSRGAGRVDLAAAAGAGLVLNETGARYRAANPAQRGDPTTLNLASLAKDLCEATCSWQRTVKSALGASANWRVQVVDPKGMSLTVEPSRFTLAPGQSQVLTVTADVAKLPAGHWVEAEIRLLAPGAPAAHLPVAVFVGQPGKVVIDSAQTAGTRAVEVKSAVEIKSFHSRVSGLVKGKVERLLMPQDMAPILPYDSKTTRVVLVDVPAGSKALGAAIAAASSFDVDLYVGRDNNGDGLAQPAEEVCRSATGAVLESCLVANPAAGRWWVLVQNWLGSGGLDEIDLATAAVPAEPSGNLTASGPAGLVAAGTPFNVTLAWNEPSLAPQEPWFALVEYGSDKQHPTNAGYLLVQLNRTG